MKNIEIEKKFLLTPCSMKRFLKERGIRYTRYKIEQFYIKSSEDGVKRYRKVGNRYIYTVKRGAGLQREEIEKYVSKSEYESAKKDIDNILKKSRYVFKIEDYRFELDVFKGSLKGLNILEIEFNTIDDADSFKMPKILKDIVIDEVTYNPNFTNGYLSKSISIPTIDKRDKIFKYIESKEHLKATAFIPLEPFMSINLAIKAVLYTLLLSIKANQEAILNGDNDIERLHQLRVAMRKIKALFTQMEIFFNKEWLKEQIDTLSIFMKTTNNKRDLDVYIQKLKFYKKLLDKKHHLAIERFGKYLKEYRDIEQNRVINMLESKDFNEYIKNLEDFAKDSSFNNLLKTSNTPVIFFVKNSIKNSYKSIVKKASLIDASSKAKEYHKLRIEFKKFRYILEFFYNSMDRESLDYIILKLKNIQNILGDFQDLQVEQKKLKIFLKDIDDKDIKEAIYLLRSQMSRLQKGKKEEFSKEVKEFFRLKSQIRRAVCRF